jgi:hypothetical protein
VCGGIVLHLVSYGILLHTIKKIHCVKRYVNDDNVLLLVMMLNSGFNDYGAFGSRGLNYFESDGSHCANSEFLGSANNCICFACVSKSILDEGLLYWVLINS